MRIKVLVAEDDINIGKLLQNFLESKGMEVTVALDGEEALNKLRGKEYSILFADLRMPCLGGIEFLERVKELAPQLPVIVMSAYGNTQEAVRAVKAGAYTFISKPFILESLPLLIEKALEEARIKQEYYQLREINCNLLRAEEIKSNLLSVVSHEFNTPLTLIKGYLIIALKDPMVIQNKMLYKRLNVAFTATKRLEKLIHNFLIMNVSKKRLTVLHRKRVMTLDFIKMVVKKYYRELRLKKLKVKLLVGKSVKKVFIDTGKVSIALENILDNAIKFSPPDEEIIIRAGMEKNYLKISIQDKGPGISKEILPVIFSPFDSGDMSSTRKFGGVGLGLAVAKMVVQAHNGYIKVETRQGKGSIFTIYIPIGERVVRK